MDQLRAIKENAKVLFEKRRQAGHELARANAMLRDQFLLAVKLVFRISIGSTVVYHGKEYQVQTIEFSSWCLTPDDWGDRKPWVKGLAIKKNGMASRVIRHLYDQWSLLPTASRTTPETSGTPLPAAEQPGCKAQPDSH